MEHFYRDLKILSKYFELVSIDEVLKFNQGDGEKGHPIISVNFDDGFNLKRGGALDVLKLPNISATAIAVLSCMGNERLMWQPKLRAIRNYRGSSKLLTELNRLNDRLGVAKGPVRSGKYLGRRTFGRCLRNRTTLKTYGLGVICHRL